MAVLTHQRLKEILKYDPGIGLFTRLITLGGKNVNGIAGTLKPKGYVVIYVDGKPYYAHRLAWFYMTGEWPKNWVDHKDLNKANNEWLNLRDATTAENLRNRKANKNNTTGYKGIHKNKDGFMVRICIGTFKSLEEASVVYDRAIKLYHGEFARAK